ncbi:MAG TPA: MFS transporter, partial [Candidatus Angelobacter sp.]|nr:MFS transporter [Candidatus Angelobacter sp.]
MVAIFHHSMKHPAPLSPHIKAMDKKKVSLSSPLLWLLIATSFGFVVVQLDVTIVNVALPQIGSRLHAGVAGLQWIVDAYTLSFAALLISAGVIADKLGSRRVYLAGFFIFTAASVVCGLAPNIGVLIAARALQGSSAALLVPSSLAILNRTAENDSSLRARMVGFWTAAGGVSIAAGPVAGGLLLASFGWRSIFLVNILLCGVAIFLVFRFVPLDFAASGAKQLDFPGQLLAILALTGLIGAVIEGGRLGPRNTVVIAGAILGTISAAIFLYIESRVSSPMLPLHFFRDRCFSASVNFGVLVNLTYYGVIFVLSLYLQQARGYSALKTGVAFLPLTATFIVSNAISGWLTARAGSRLPMVLGALVAMLGYVLLLRLDAATSMLSMMGAFVLIPGGMGLAVPAMTTAILSSVPHERSGTASAVLNTARQAGGAIGVAVFGALLGQTHEKIIPGLHVAGWISTALLTTAAVLAWLGLRKKPVQEF